jgi:hypothetical protein
MRRRLFIVVKCFSEFNPKLFTLVSALRSMIRQARPGMRNAAAMPMRRGQPVLSR